MTIEEKTAAEKLIKLLENFDGIYSFKAEDDAMDTVLYKLFSRYGFPDLHGDMATPKRNRAMIAFLQRVYIGGENIMKKFDVIYEACYDGECDSECEYEYAYTVEEAIDYVKSYVVDHVKDMDMKVTVTENEIIVEDDDGKIGRLYNFRISE